jgi:uncharacterized protein YkwD
MAPQDRDGPPDGGSRRSVRHLGRSRLVDRSLMLVNEAREAEGLEPLEVEAALVDAADTHAEDMLERGYHDHVSPDGETVRDRYLAAGGDDGLLVLENLALCEGCPTPPEDDRVASFHDGWMESPEHRDAIIHPGVERFGFAMRWDGERVHGVQTFAGPGLPRGLAPGETPEEMPSAALRDHALAQVNEVRENGGLAPLEPSDALHDLAGALVQDGRLEEPEGGLAEALPERAAPGEVVTLSGQCGGCGRVPTAVDVEDFLDDWLAEPALEERLLDPEATGFGYALTADGEGRKAAAAAIGAAR